MEVRCGKLIRVRQILWESIILDGAKRIIDCSSKTSAMRQLEETWA